MPRRRSRRPSPPPARRFSAGSALVLLMVLWLGQLLAMGWFFHDSTLSTYFTCRRIYAPGLALFDAVGPSFLPASYFLPLNREGIMVGLAFASLLYAAVALGACLLLRSAGSRK